MSSETSLFGKETVSESPLLTECHLVDPKQACSDIVGSIKGGEKIILAAIGMGRSSVRAAIILVEASFTELARVTGADGLFEPNSPSRLEARGIDSDQRPLTVVFQLNDSNRVDSGHFFLETQ